MKRLLTLFIILTSTMVLSACIKHSGEGDLSTHLDIIPEENNSTGSTGDPESPSGYTVTKLDDTYQITDSIDVDIVDDYENGYNKVERLFCDSSKWQNPVINNNDIIMESIDEIYKIEQHFSYGQSMSTLFFIENDDTAYCFKSLIDGKINLDNLYKCDYDDFLYVKNIFNEQN